MPDLDEISLEMLLREHLSAELNGQLGRPAAGFLAHAVVDIRANVTRDEAGLSSAALSARPISPAAGTGHFNVGRFKFHRFNGWFIGMAGAALAASIAALWAAPAAFRGRVPAMPVRAVQPARTSPPPELAVNNAGTPDGSGTTDLADLPGQAPLVQWVQNRTLDEGTVVLDDPDRPVPARKLRQQQLEHMQYYDPARRTHVEMTVPREKIKFVEMDTY